MNGSIEEVSGADFLKVWNNGTAGTAGHNIAGHLLLLSI